MHPKYDEPKVWWAKVQIDHAINLLFAVLVLKTQSTMIQNVITLSMVQCNIPISQYCTPLYCNLNPTNRPKSEYSAT